MNQLINDKGVSKAAPATPVCELNRRAMMRGNFTLLKNSHIFHTYL